MVSNRFLYICALKRIGCDRSVQGQEWLELEIRYAHEANQSSMCPEVKSESHFCGKYQSLVLISR